MHSFFSTSPFFFFFPNQPNIVSTKPCNQGRDGLVAMLVRSTLMKYTRCWDKKRAWYQRGVAAYMNTRNVALARSNSVKNATSERLFETKVSLLRLFFFVSQRASKHKRSNYSEEGPFLRDIESFTRKRLIFLKIKYLRKIKTIQTTI